MNQRQRPYWQFLTLCTVLCMPLLAQAADPPPADNQVRVLIDISGSMKQNDPNNLRAPAVRLFTTLLPEQNQAGLWLFGQYVNNVVPSGQASAQWKERARAAAAKINSAGQYTNIEGAVHDATWDWRRPAPLGDRTLILLTDGLVDISPDDAKDKASRDNILQKLLPALVQAGVKIYTVALSRDADSALLEQMAAASGGTYTQIDSAEQLERLFLRLFDTVAKADTLPMAGNKVSIDKSVSEATFLIFSKEGAQPTRLTAPDGRSFGKADAPAEVRWYNEARYDLITINAPQAGEWQVIADLDPDNRVTIVTDLKMQTTELPDNLASYQAYQFAARIEEHGEPLRSVELLRFIQVSLRQFSAIGGRHEIAMRDDGQEGDTQAGDGVFTSLLGQTLISGPSEFVVVADGKTFQREFRKRVTVYDNPVNAAVRPVRDKPHQYELTVLGFQDLIDPQSVQVTAEITAPNGVLNNFSVPRISAAAWVQELDISTAPGDYTARVHVIGKSPQGIAIDRWLEAIHFGGPPSAAKPEPVTTMMAPLAPEPVAEEPKPVEVAPAAEPEAAAPAEPVKAAEPEPVPAGPEQAPPAPAEAEEGGGWLMPVIIGVVLVLLAAGGGAGFWFWRQKQKAAKQAAAVVESAEPAVKDADGARAMEDDDLDLEFDAEPPVEQPAQGRPVIPELDDLLDGEDLPKSATPSQEEIAAIPDNLLDIGDPEDTAAKNGKS